MRFTPQEKARIVAEYIRNESITRTQRWVRTQIRKQPPARNTIIQWHTRFLESANISHRGGNGRPRTSEQTVEQVRLMFQDQPQLSIREAASVLDISTATVHRILRKCLFMYPYRLQNFHGLQNSDKIKRLQFARHCQNQPEGYSEYLSKIVFSDECIFRLNGSVNKQNVRIWGTERPTDGNQSFMNSPSVMVWCAIGKEKVIGPYFFENENVNGENYRNMLINYAFPRFASLRRDYIFHQDGAPPHYSNRVRNYLNRKRPGNWIGRGGPVEWPPRSPDLTPCDFFLWGHIKGKVYNTPVTSLEDLKTRIRRECRQISPETLRKVWDNTKLRLNVLENVRGGHIESIVA